MIMDLHRKPFDEGTISKLEIFELYTKEWLPTFIMSNCENIWIFDFFAGTGYDKANIPGSPIRILQQVVAQIGNIFQHRICINICLNEYEKCKFKLLKSACENFCKENAELQRAIKSGIIKLCYYNEDFSTLFSKKIEEIKRYPSLVFLDQNGIKFLSDKYFQELISSKTTDFLYFLSSSYILRFGKTNEFQMNLNIDLERAQKNPYQYIHRSILDQLREKIPTNSQVQLYPFSIKKGSNIYGIIFGASHPRAVDKFLKTAWEQNHLNGEANFDIDSDEEKCQLDLFKGKSLTKIEKFAISLRQLILNREITTNKEAYIYTLNQGHISTHATDEIKKMKREKLINYIEKSPLINYEQVYKNQRIVNFEVLNENNKNRMD